MIAKDIPKNLQDAQKILLTVAIPTYNREEFLGRAMDSVLSQITDEVELLISDNASQDGTEALVEEKMREYPSIRYLRNSENIGPDANFLQCMKEAGGKFILLLGSDDVLAKGAVRKMLAFIKREPECVLIFLNHAFFTNECDSKHISDPFLEKKQEGFLATKNKRTFAKLCSHRLTYMSSFLLAKSAFDTVKNPEKYYDTYFLHTCIAIEAARGKESTLGVIFDVCVLQDITIGNAGVDKNLSSTFRIFGKGMEYALCTVTKEFSFAPKTMRKIYVRRIGSGWRGTIVKLKAEGDPAFKAQFREFGLPVLRKHPIARIRLAPYYLMPNGMAKWVYRYIRPLYKKIKHKS